MKTVLFLCMALLMSIPETAFAQTNYVDENGKLRIALNQQPFVPNGQSKGPSTMASGGIQDILKEMGAVIRVTEARLTEEESKEYGNWKKLGYALGHLGNTVEKNEEEGYFNVGFLGTCPSLPGMLAGLQHSGPTPDEIKVGLLWLDAHGDFNTPETTRSGSLGGMPVAVATGRCLHRIRLDAGLDPPVSERHVVMGAVRLNDPLEQHMLDQSYIQQLSVDDIRHITPAVYEQLDRLSEECDKIYVQVDMDVLDPAEVPNHGSRTRWRIQPGVGGVVQDDLQQVSEGVRTGLCDHSVQRSGPGGFKGHSQYGGWGGRGAADAGG